MRRKFKVLMIVGVLLLTGCFKRDSFENIKIYTTVYPIEYVLDNLYGENSEISSIYPDGIEIDSYQLNEKQITDYSAGDLFVFDSLSFEKEYVIPMFGKNKNLKIIDATSTMNIEYEGEELFMSPSNFLKVISNVKDGLLDYITNQYLKNEINERYENLRIEISSLDANLRQVTKNASSKSIVIGDNAFQFLENYDFDVISLASDDVSDRTIADVKQLIESKTIKYIYVKDLKSVNKNVQLLLDLYEIELIELHTLINLSEDDRGSDKDYVYLMNENIEKLKREIFD